MNIKKTEYQGWPNCYRMENERVELVMTTDVGPRIIRFGFRGGENEFYENPDLVGKTGGSAWMGYGGHRLWHAPEDLVRTYMPDNSPVAFESHSGMAHLIQPVEAGSGIQKEMDIVMDEKEARATVVHRLWNRNLWAVELAPWAITVMHGGGTAILPLPPRQSHQENLLPSNTLALWGYTDLSDPRWVWGQKHILLRQDPKSAAPQKIGIHSNAGWIAYARGGRLFAKKTAYDKTATYPDLGCNLEMYTDSSMLEIETLGPLASLAPGQKVEYREEWFLFNNVPTPKNDGDVERDVLPMLSASLKS